MADAWGGAWGTTWGVSWGSTVVVAQVPTGAGNIDWLKKPKKKKRRNRWPDTDEPSRYEQERANAGFPVRDKPLDVDVAPKNVPPPLVYTPEKPVEKPDLRPLAEAREAAVRDLEQEAKQKLSDEIMLFSKSVEALGAEVPKLLEEITVFDEMRKELAKLIKQVVHE